MSFVVDFTNPAKIENPFLWKPEEQLESVPDDMIGRLSLKIEEKSLEPEIEFESYFLHLALSYEHLLKGNVDQSLRILRNMSDEMGHLTRSESSEGGIRSWFSAVEHLLRSATIHVLLFLKNFDEAEKEFEKIKPILSLDTKNQAAIWGIRASFYAEYGMYGSKAGLQFATKANKMDPDESLWFFVKGKLLGRVRRVEKPFDIPSPCELEALETAVASGCNVAAYAIFTAQVYRETANRVFRKHKNERTVYPNLKQIIDEMNAKSLQLYKKSLSLKPYCAHVNFRCAKGFMSLPPPFKDTDLAKKCIKDGLKMSSTSAYGNHVMAMYYERYEKDIRSAVDHLKICVKLRVFGACIDLLRLEYVHSGLSNREVAQRLNGLYNDFLDSARRCQILCHLVAFHLFLEYDLKKAIDYLLQALRLNSSCDDIRNLRCLFLDLFFTISLLDVVVDEVKIQLCDKDCSAETRDACNKFLSNLDHLNVRYPRNRPRYLRESLLRQSASFGQRLKPGPKSRRPRFDNNNNNASSRQPLNSNTLTYLQRRNRLVATDQTLKKIDDFTNSWRNEVSSKGATAAAAAAAAINSRPGTGSLSRITAADAGSDDADGGASASDGSGDDDSSLSSMLRLAEIRYESKPRQHQHQPQPQPPQHQPDGGRRRRESRPDEQLESLAALSISAGDECGADFDECVRAYRRAKRESSGAAAATATVAPAPAAPHHAAKLVDGGRDARRRSPASAAVSANWGPSKSGAASAKTNSSTTMGPKGRHKTAKSRDTFDNYLARSAAELKSKFEPDDIRF